MRPEICMICNDKKRFETEISKTRLIFNRLRNMDIKYSDRNFTTEEHELLRQLKMNNKHPHFMCGNCFRVNISELKNIEYQIDVMLVCISKNIKEKDETYYNILQLLRGEYSGKYHIFERYCLQHIKEKGDD